MSRVKLVQMPPFCHGVAFLICQLNIQCPDSIAEMVTFSYNIQGDCELKQRCSDVTFYTQSWYIQTSYKRREMLNRGGGGGAGCGACIFAHSHDQKKIALHGKLKT